MVKQKHHTCRNKSYKEHRQGIKKVQRNRYVNTKGVRFRSALALDLARVERVLASSAHPSRSIIPVCLPLASGRAPQCTPTDGPEVPQVPAVLSARLCFKSQVVARSFGRSVDEEDAPGCPGASSGKCEVVASATRVDKAAGRQRCQARLDSSRVEERAGCCARQRARSGERPVARARNEFKRTEARKVSSFRCAQRQPRLGCSVQCEVPH